VREEGRREREERGGGGGRGGKGVGRGMGERNLRHDLIHSMIFVQKNTFLVSTKPDLWQT
jgi:hypothetical protein